MGPTLELSSGRLRLQNGTVGAPWTMAVATMANPMKVALLIISGDKTVLVGVVEKG